MLLSELRSRSQSRAFLSVKAGARALIIYRQLHIRSRISEKMLRLRSPWYVYVMLSYVHMYTYTVNVYVQFRYKKWGTAKNAIFVAFPSPKCCRHCKCKYDLHSGIYMYMKDRTCIHIRSIRYYAFKTCFKYCMYFSNALFVSNIEKLNKIA